MRHDLSERWSSDTDTVEFERWIVPEQAEALAGLLSVPTPQAREGDALPPLWHWVYMTERPPQAMLGVDGHPKMGIPAPPGPEQLRMFAGGRVTSLAPLQFGLPAIKTTWLAQSVEKQGRSGPLTFATTRSEIRQNGSVAIVEEQDIVYREQGAGTIGIGDIDAGTVDPELEMDIDSVVLFRFSALTYNAHRIHYDRPYASREGYPDLVVHGPLQALLMAEAFRRNDALFMNGAEFSYRLLSPTFGSQRIRVIRSPDDARGETLKVCDARGVVTATSTLRVAAPL